MEYLEIRELGGGPSKLQHCWDWAEYWEESRRLVVIQTPVKYQQLLLVQKLTDNNNNKKKKKCRKDEVKKYLWKTEREK